MPGPVLTIASVITCPHGPPASVVSANARVTASGAPVATMADAYPVSGCPFQVPVGAGTKPQPCLQVRWAAPATRVLVNGMPPVLATSPGLGVSGEGIPQGPAVVGASQPRVVAI
jgi:hypothetical protein